ncbi:transthyretin-like family protein [Teredinibacter purpureus]|uniref:hypothetical protein n=1 Tax=Teredinibacter purpureus TaxID=2731756 RepID=UPI0013C40BFA|nr:hypothetical protein [Teredinibacter purpureus]
MKVALTFIIILMLSSCAAGRLSGRLVAESGVPIGGAEVKLWKNQFSFMSLPENVASTKTKDDGSFEISTDERVSFVTFDSETCYGVLNNISKLQKDGENVSFPECK